MKYILLDDKIKMMYKGDRRKEERINDSFYCAWHDCIPDMPLYHGIVNPKDSLYKCIVQCDGYKPNCQARTTLENIDNADKLLKVKEYDK